MAFELNLERVGSVEGEWEEFSGEMDIGADTVLLGDGRGPRGQRALQNLENGESRGWKH